MIADRYEVGEIIGRGGMAEVFAGLDRRLDRPVAIKLLLPIMAARPDIRTRFEAEARAAASLSHPNAVAVFDTGETEGVPYIVMERLGGETLGDRMRAGPVDPAWLVAVATEVLAALAAAHAAGLVHRDVKPANILLAGDGRAKVADFGIAKSVDAGDGADLTLTGQVLGTPAYLAPELLEGAAAGPRSDLWALGVTLYEALAGFKPFSGSTALATAQAVTAGEHQPLSVVRPDLDAGLVSVIGRAMARDPAARFASADDMAAALSSPAVEASTVADTVEIAGSGSVPDGTLVLGADELVVPAAAVPAAPPPAARSRGPGLRRVLIGAVVAGVIVLVVALLVRSGSDTGPPSSVAAGPTSTGSRRTTTVAPTTVTPNTPAPGAALARQLRDAAAQLGSGNGRLGDELASRLETLADRVESGDGASDATASDATALLATTLGLARAGQITPDAAASVAQVLAQVPGVDQSIVDALGAILTPTTDAPTPAPGREKKGKD